MLFDSCKCVPGRRHNWEVHTIFWLRSRNAYCFCFIERSWHHSQTIPTGRFPLFFVSERVLIALTHRNLFTLFKAGKKTLVMERCLTITFEVNRIEVYQIFSQWFRHAASEGEWLLSRQQVSPSGLCSQTKQRIKRSTSTSHSNIFRPEKFMATINMVTWKSHDTLTNWRHLISSVSVRLPDSSWRLGSPNNSRCRWRFSTGYERRVHRWCICCRHPRMARPALGVCPQFTAMDSQLTFREHLIVYGRLKGLSKVQELEESVEAILQGTALNMYVDRLASKLEGTRENSRLLLCSLETHPLYSLMNSQLESTLKWSERCGKHYVGLQEAKL